MVISILMDLISWTSMQSSLIVQLTYCNNTTVYSKWSIWKKTQSERMYNSTKLNVSIMIEESYSSTSIPKSLAIAVSVMLSIFILAGAFGNALVCNRLRSRRDLRKVPHYLLASLSLTGLLTSLSGMPFLLITHKCQFTFWLAIYQSLEILCKVGFSLSVGCMALNALTLMVMALDRHDCVVRPFNRRLSTQNVKKILLVTWLLAFIITAVLLVLLRKETSVCYAWFPYNFSQSFRTERGNVIRVYVTTMAQLDTLAILLVIITFFRVVKKLRSLVMTNSSTRQRQEKQLTWLTYGICGTYILFRFSLIICNIVASAEKFQGTTLNTAFLIDIHNDVFHFRFKSSSSF